MEISLHPEKGGKKGAAQEDPGRKKIKTREPLSLHRFSDQAFRHEGCPPKAPDLPVFLKNPFHAEKPKGQSVLFSRKECHHPEDQKGNDPRPHRHSPDGWHSESLPVHGRHGMIHRKMGAFRLPPHTPRPDGPKDSRHKRLLLAAAPDRSWENPASAAHPPQSPSYSGSAHPSRNCGSAASLPHTPSIPSASTDRRSPPASGKPQPDATPSFPVSLRTDDPSRFPKWPY